MGFAGFDSFVDGTTLLLLLILVTYRRRSPSVSMSPGQTESCHLLSSYSAPSRCDVGLLIRVVPFLQTPNSFLSRCLEMEEDKKKVRQNKMIETVNKFLKLSKRAYSVICLLLPLAEKVYTQAIVFSLI